MTEISADDKEMMDAITEAEVAINEVLFLTAQKGIETRLETGAGPRSGVIRNWVRVRAWRKTVLRD